MTALAYARGSYKRSDLPEMRVVNQYVESVPSEDSPVVLIGRPGLAVYSDLSTDPVRGIFTESGALGGDIFAVAGSTLFREASAIGEIDGSQRVCMASSSSQLLVTGGATLYLATDSDVLPVDFPDAAPVSAVAFINGYFLASRAGAQRFYWSAVLDGSSWDGLDYASAERGPDAIVHIEIVSDQIWIFGEATTEIWATTGDSTAPFQRIDGRLYDKGCVSRDTVARMDNSVFWVADDGIVYRGDSTPVRVSTHGIEERIAASASTDLRAWAFPWKGHIFYALTTSKGTFCYDPATQEWCQFASYGRETWRAHLGVFKDGVVIAGDDETGRLWRLDDGQLLDGDGQIVRVFTALAAPQSPVFGDSVMLDASTGTTPSPSTEPSMEVRISRDGGNTYSSWRATSMGRQGAYRARSLWRRFGMLDEPTIFEFRLSDPTPWRISSVQINAPLAGRSR